MLLVKILDFDKGRVTTYHGTRQQVMEFLHLKFPETLDFGTVEEAVEAINSDGFYEVTVEVPKSTDSNLLPEDFLTHDQGDDPPRPTRLHDEQSPDT